MVSNNGNPKGFLGVGWKFPIRTNAEGQIALSEYEEDIRESIYIILGTSKGERVMRPDFGCGIHDFVFDINNISVLGRMKDSIYEALTRWEPRINVTRVEVFDDDIENGKLLISIDYRVRTTNNRYNLVYPFFITEGG